MMATDVAPSVAAQYASNLRGALIKELFEGDESQISGGDDLGENVDISDLIGDGDVVTLQV